MADGFVFGVSNAQQVVGLKGGLFAMKNAIVDTMIMPGVKIGPGSVVAARALVNKDVPPGTMVAGVPAKGIRTEVQFRC